MVTPSDRRDDPWSLRAAAEEAGDRPALIAGDAAWTWRELAVAAEEERSALRVGDAESGEGRGRVVAFEARPEPRTVIRLLAAFEAGVSAAPLPAGLPAVARGERLDALAPCLDLETGELHEAGDSSRWETRPGSSGRPPLAVLFTSGSSGRPRAVQLTGAAFRASAAASARNLGWRPDDRWLCCLPLAHVGGLSIVTRSLLARRTVVLTPGFEAADVAETIVRHAVTLASFVPTMLHRLFALSPDWSAPAGLRAVLLGGAPAGEELWEEVARRGFPALATYGMTETCSQVATGHPGGPRRLRPLDGVRLRIAEGRIEVAGPMLASRVRADAGATVFTPDGYLRTGDVGRLDEGALVVEGRADDTIVTGGENVAPAEVEAVLERHPAIRRAVVFGVPDAEWGERVAATLEPVDAPVSGVELRDWCAGRLAVHQRPRRVAWLAALPTTASGKVDRKAAAVACRDGGEEV